MKLLNIFDLDDTLFCHRDDILTIKLVDEVGNLVKTLTPKEYANIEIPNGHKFDYSDFRSAELFSKSVIPVRQMLQLLHLSSELAETVILTARADFDDQQLFSEVMHSYGIDIHKIHVIRAGNRPGRGYDVKYEVIDELLKNKDYDTIIMYDDSQKNIDKFLELKHVWPNVAFFAYLVNVDGDTVNLLLETV